ncbi:MAG: thioredoxin fold domain-containing protein [Gammaproteobacteria bacterium]|nr:thioredoxin fold domain-containing protein [Gammaproteobacteria bacterium]
MLILISSIPLQSRSNGTIHEVSITTDLATLGKNSAQTNRPILLLMSSEECPYCLLVKREILNPMILSGDYKDRIMIYELMIDSPTDLHDFDGKMKDASIIARRYKIKVTPTMLFLAPDGTELTKKIVGINAPELFSFYVDKAIDKAVLKLTTE